MMDERDGGVGGCVLRCWSLFQVKIQSRSRICSRAKCKKKSIEAYQSIRLFFDEVPSQKKGHKIMQHVSAY